MGDGSDQGGLCAGEQIMSALIGRPDSQVIRTFFPEFYRMVYHTPSGLDDILLTSDGTAITGLRFLQNGAQSPVSEEQVPVFEEAARWLDDYFAGHPGSTLPKIRIEELTPFRKEVLSRLMEIPYGETVTYGEIAQEIAQKRSTTGRMSAQAVGGAVGWNPICIMIPCHRVIGADGSLTGYGGGIENKRWLLVHEGIL
ncbi:methylated-DNA--[protein]-cysteine S-methyltransferase [Eubacterium sp. AB3007]|uniref:methylated-DNA--[protein]-cysteine S-methyltransferase n=1 Tax=Eubacterium sp. AB3007 TaxID=1392487 RepID=UPI0026F3E29E|nr:methylated-DNA--[protein]-cysteine S-methyltransferase [Eubacterium sp. AB3007]